MLNRIRNAAGAISVITGLALAAFTAPSCGSDDTGPTTSSTGSGGGGGTSGTTSTGSAGGEPNGICSGDSWCWSLPLPQGNNLLGAWGDGKGTLWVVGELGTVLRFDGSSWTRFDSGLAGTLNGIWGASPTSIWALGNDGIILHFDGHTWAPQKTPKSDGGIPEPLYDVWGTGENDVWAVGAGGAILHFDGKSWTDSVSPTTLTLRSVVGLGKGDVKAVGDGGAVVSFDGTSWTGGAFTNGMTRIRVGVDGDYWASDVANNIFHFVMAAWAQVGAASFPMRDFFVETDDAIWFAGVDVADLDFAAMPMTLSSIARPSTDEIAVIWSDRGGELYFVGDGGSVLKWTDSDKSWTILGGGDGADRLALGGTKSDEVLSVGDEALEWDGSRWSGSATGSDRALYGVGFDGKGDAWAVGTGGTILNRKGKTWSAVNAETFAWLHGLWFGPTSGWVVGDGGLLLTQFQSTWQPVVSGTTQTLNAVFGVADNAVWAVGDAGTILHWDGMTWKPQVNGVVGGGATISLRAVWASAKNDAWAAGAEGTLLHFNGTSWSDKTQGMPTYSLNSVWGSGANDVYAVGTDGITLHYDGKAWTQQDAGTDQTLNAVWGTSPSDVWISGEGGVILHRTEAP